jgi:anaerobic magnesium-protoporphyrin IX monomethyl ester cyclase
MVWEEKRMHVTLVNPPYPQGAHQHPPFTPLGLGYLAAVLEQNNYKVDVVDCQASHLTYDDFRQEIRKRKPNVVGLTSTTLTYKSALQIIRIVKDAHPKCLTVIGGCHVTFWDDKALQECPELDVVVRKEGEQTILEISEQFKECKDFEGILGVTYRKDGKIVRNPDRPYIEDLDSLPFPAHHLWSLENLRKYGKIIFPLMTSRGCVYWCEFCSAVRMFGRGYRMRSAKNVVDEMEYLHKKYDAKDFTFYDDAFTVDQKRVEEICKELHDRKLNVKWDCGTRVDMVNKELLQLMKDSGCIAVWFGVEAGSQRVLDDMGKGFTATRTREAFKMAQDIGLLTIASVVLGFPGETRESALETVKFIEEINPDDVGYYIATPYPGTPMAEKVKKSGWLRVTDFDKYDTATPIFELPTLNMEELRKIRENAFHSFYLRPTYILRMFAKGGTYGYSATKTALSHLIRAIKTKL